MVQFANLPQHPERMPVNMLVQVKGKPLEDVEDLIADLHELARDQKTGRETQDEITLFKNGGGAHLDLMVARHILETWSAGQR